MSDIVFSSSIKDNLKKALTELLILFLLSEQDRYIGELTTLINQRSNGALAIVFPYSAVYRLQESGFICELGRRIAPDGRRRQYFAITEAGKAYLDQLLQVYTQFSKGVESVLNSGGEKKNEQ